MKIATHNGNFHADEVFAIATLKLLGLVDEVIRTRDIAKLKASDLRVDIGQRYDPSKGDFDHHQVGGAGKRANGIPYASFGLIWKHYGDKLCGSSQTADIVDAKLVQIIDAHDNGINVYKPLIKGLTISAVDRSIFLFNPAWDENQEESHYYELFMQTIGIAERFLKREVAMASSKVKAVVRVRRAIGKSQDGTVITLDKFLPWKETVVEEAPKALFVIYPRLEGTWAVQAIPKQLGKFENRRDLPLAWAGKIDDQLQSITKVQDALFCHSGRFIAIAKSQAGANELSKLAVLA